MALELTDIASQLGPAYARFPAAERERHLALLARVVRAEDVALAAERLPDGRWRVVVCSADRVGVLSLITGVLAARRVDIDGGDVFTVRVPRPEGIARRALDVFDVRAPAPVDERFWDDLRAELVALLRLLVARDPDSARDRVVDRVSEAARARPQGPALPVSVEVEDAEQTLLHIRSTDAPGFLFELTNALALLGVNIERVEIRTVAVESERGSARTAEVRDTFWVTDATGQKLGPARVQEVRAAAALIKQFTDLLPRAPDPAQALRQFSMLIREMIGRPDWVNDLASLRSDAVLRTMAELLGVSEFLWEDFLRVQYENLFPVVRDVPALDQVKDRATLVVELDRELASGDEQTALLNRYKDREMFRIDLRFITGRTDFESFSRELSLLGDLVVERAWTQALRAPGPWGVFAIGKLGGRELGFASDVELIFVYGGDAPGQPYVEAVQALLGNLATRREGIFEIDLQIRPHGRAGALASSLETFRGFFADGGGATQLERMALVKLRPIAADPALAAAVLATRDAFVYSGKPVDYEEIARLRARQARELVPPGEVSAKFSPGGVVDLEYFVQTRQLEAGARDPSVRVANTLDAIAALGAAGVLASAPELAETYGFLRRLGEALRVVRGHARDLTLPARDGRGFAHLARRLRYKSPAELASEIDRRMAFARSLWPRG